jgi:hypothetical protein
MTVTKKRLELQQDRVVHRMEKVFEKVFKSDGKMPRVWKPGVELAAIYDEACAKGEKVLELYTVLRLEEGDDKLKLLDESQKIPEDKRIMTRTKAQSILSAYEAFTTNACSEAQRAIDQFGKASSVPTILVILIVILGWNEFMYLLSNPMMLVLLITLATAGYAVHAMGMTPVVLPIVNAAYTQAMGMLNEFISKATNASAPPAAGAPKPKKPKKD